MLALFALLFPLALSASEQYNKNFSFKLRNVTVKEIFHYIEKNSEYVFLYAPDKDLSQKVSIDVHNKNLNEILDEILKHTELVYEIDGKQVIVKENKKALQAEAAQQSKKSVTGLLTDADGNPIIGVTIVVKGTTNGVTTDINGRYILKGLKIGDIIEYRFIGFNTEERKYKGESTINVRLVESSVGLEDVVIIGYGQQKKESLVSSVNTISSNELQAPSRSLSNNIAGQIAGVLAVQRSGEPGYDNSTFWIRGISSFAGGTTPLVLVDGIPRSMNDITPDEIESFTVLKDAAATAVYGAEGANGVVLITSKRGQSQKPTLDVRAEFSMVTPARMPKLLGSYDYLSLYNEATWESLGNPTVWTKPYSDQVLEMYRTHSDPDLYPDTDWLSLVKEWTHNERVTLNLRGGSERVKYFVSGAFYNEAGIFDSKAIDKYDANINLSRYNIRSNIDIAVTKTTDLAVDMSGQYLESTYPGYSTNDIFTHMFQYGPHKIPMRYSDGTFAESVMYNGTTEQNPYNMLNESGYTRDWYAYLQTKITLKQKLDFITKGLSIKLTGSFDASYSSSVKRSKSPTIYNLQLNEDGEKEYILINEGKPNLTSPWGNWSGGEKQIYLETSLNYDRTFNDVHDVHGIVLYMQKARQSQGNGLPYKKQSVVARISYGYDNRYMVEGSFGLTGSENFAKGYRYGIFPAVGAAWYISNERFMEDTKDFINKLKLRISYGLTGNDDVGGNRFPYLGDMDSNNIGYSFGFKTGTGGGGTNYQGGVIEGRFAAPYLSWEIEEKKNIGLDLGLWQGRVDLSVDFFKNDRRDILMPRNTISAMTGFRQAPWQNFGKMSNKGFDGNIILKQNINKVMLTFRGNVTYAKNKIEEYDEVRPKYDYQIYTGHSLGTPLVYIADGLYTPDDFIITENPTDGSKTYTLKDGLPRSKFGEVKPGDIKYRDLNGDNVIDDYDRTYNHDLYSENPEWVYGFGLSGEWKGFYAGVFFQGVANASINIKSGAFIPFEKGDKESVRSEVLTSHWSSNDPYNQNVIFPRLYPSQYTHNSLYSTWWFRSGNFLRLKNIEFGYEFDSKVLAQHWIKKARLYVQGNNIAVWDDIKMWDPELGSANGGQKYPLSMTWTVGVELGF